MAVQISGNDITVPRDGSFTRNVTIGGTLTYEDVTNIDSVGLVTARNGIEIGARPGVAASISVDGNMIVSGISTFNGDVKLDGGNLVLGDSGGATDDRLTFGAGTDLSIYHNGSNSYIDDSGTGNLFIRSNEVRINKYTNEYMIRAIADGAVELYHDNSKKIETTSTGVSVTGGVAASGGNITLGDSGSATDDRVALGAGGDLQLFHDGTNSVISNQTGDFYIENDSSSTSEKILIRAKAGESSINCLPNGAVELYYDNGKMFETLTDGVSVVGAELRFQGQASRLIKYRSGDNDMIYEGTSGFFMRQDIGNSRHEFYVGNNKKVSISADGLLFGTETAAAHALDDYEEGTYTPVVNDGNGNTLTYGTSAAGGGYTLRSSHSGGGDSDTISYTKIGNKVFLGFTIFFNTSFTGRYSISLPVAYLGSAYQLCTVPAYYGITLSTGDTLGTLGGTTTTIETFKINNNSGGHSSVPITSSGEVYYNFHYTTA